VGGREPQAAIGADNELDTLDINNGPKTPKGKKRASKNSTKTGEHCAELRLLRRMLAEHNQQLRDLDRRTK
jgi:hypothetical protein